MVVVAGVVGIASTAAVLAPAAARLGRVATVGLVRPEGAAPLLSEVLLRVTGELRSSGLEPRIIEVGPREAASCDPTDAERSRACLARLSAERGVDAVLALAGDPVPGTVAVWAADRAAGRSVWRRMSVRTGHEHVAETLAIRAGELLRSCLVEIDLITRESGASTEPSAARPSPELDRSGELATGPRSAVSAAPRPPPGPAAVTPATPPTPEIEATAPEVRSAPAPTTETRTPAGEAAGAPEAAPPPGATPVAWAAGVGAGVAAVMSLDGVGPALLPEIRLSAALGSGWIVRLTAAGLGTSAPVANGTGDASVTQDQLLGGVYYHLRFGRRVRPQLALRAGALRTSAEGRARADASNLGRRATQWSLLLDGGAGVALSLGARADVVLAAHLQLAEPYPAVRFVDQVVATTAHPGFLMTAAIDVWP